MSQSSPESQTFGISMLIIIVASVVVLCCCVFCGGYAVCIHRRGLRGKQLAYNDVKEHSIEIKEKQRAIALESVSQVGTAYFICEALPNNKILIAANRTDAKEGVMHGQEFYGAAHSAVPMNYTRAVSL